MVDCATIEIYSAERLYCGFEFEGILSQSRAFREVLAVLLLGETGTGKELMARCYSRAKQR
jgi:transcriptional regulator with GAF, ATPase, and Fis domain